jgi:hypothetical protein
MRLTELVRASNGRRNAGSQAEHTSFAGNFRSKKVRMITYSEIFGQNQGITFVNVSEAVLAQPHAIGRTVLIPLGLGPVSAKMQFIARCRCPSVRPQHFKAIRRRLPDCRLDHEPTRNWDRRSRWQLARLKRVPRRTTA